MKRLLIYAHYYVPDVASTGQIIRELAEGMLDIFDITVICVVPSYTGKIEDKYKKRYCYIENINNVKVVRIKVPEFDKASKKSRIWNILCYFFGAMIATFWTGRQDYVISISQPPVCGGILGVWGKWVKHAKYIYNIQDFNPEQIMAVKYSQNQLMLKMMMWMDKFSCKCSDVVITVGRDLAETMNIRFAGKKVPKTVIINNWIDEKEIYPLSTKNEGVKAFRNKYGLEDKFVIMYSGNIGLYYDLENLIKIMERFRKGYTVTKLYDEGPKTADGREVVFAFVGTGALLEKLKQYAKQNNFENIIFIPYQSKKTLIYSLNSADVHWCINARGIKGVSVPSKIYGIMAAGKPVLGVLEKGTEARYLIEDACCGKCSEPGDYEEIECMIKWFIDNADTEDLKQMGINGRKYLNKFLTKDSSIQKYREVILKC